MRCACWVRWETLDARKMTIDELRILRGLSMTKLCEAAGLSMGAVFKLTRPGAELERAQLGTVMKLAAGLGAVITVDPEGVTIRPQEEANENQVHYIAEDRGRVWRPGPFLWPGFAGNFETTGETSTGTFMVSLGFLLLAVLLARVSFAAQDMEKQKNKIHKARRAP
mgnify:CR=1 FL=1